MNDKIILVKKRLSVWLQEMGHHPLKVKVSPDHHTFIVDTICEERN